MSDTSFFGTLPRITRIRQGAVAVLLSQATLAGANVNDTPFDPIAETIDCAINVFSKEKRTTKSAAGGRPCFNVDFTITVQMFYRDADEGQATLSADLLKQQVLDALFEDPVWISAAFAGPINEVQESFSTRSDGRKHVAEYIVGIIGGFVEEYAARTDSVLRAIGPPNQAQAVMSPLITVKNTIVAGTAADSSQTAFTDTVTLPID